jgi:hypothetical protein
MQGCASRPDSKGKSLGGQKTSHRNRGGGGYVQWTDVYDIQKTVSLLLQSPNNNKLLINSLINGTESLLRR